MRERTAEVNRLQKTLEGANIKLAAVATDVVGSRGARCWRRWWRATDAAAMAELAQGKLRGKRPQLEQALTGRFGPHQRFLVAQHLAHIDVLDEQIAGERRDRRAPAPVRRSWRGWTRSPAWGGTRPRCCWPRSART